MTGEDAGRFIRFLSLVGNVKFLDQTVLHSENVLYGSIEQELAVHISDDLVNVDCNMIPSLVK